MFRMQSYDVIPEIVEAMLPRFTEGKVLLVTLRATVAQPGKNYSDPHTQFRTVHFAFYRPNNYTKVGMHIEAHRGTTAPGKNHVWQVTSDHDSCWRTDGVNSPLSQLYFEMCKQVDPDARPIDLDTMLEFGIFGGIRLRELASSNAVTYIRPQGGRNGDRTWTIQFTYQRA